MLVAAATAGPRRKTAALITPRPENEAAKVYRPSTHFPRIVFRTNIAAIVRCEEEVKKVGATRMDRQKSGGLFGMALILMVFALAGCAQTSPVRKAKTPSGGQTAMQLPARAIIYFQSPTADSEQLSTAISEACQCRAVFFRPFLGDGLIYEIALPPGHTFAAFADALKRNAAQLGIKAVEPDSIMQHQ